MKLCLGCMGRVKDYSAPCPHCGFDLRTHRQEAYYLRPGAVIAGKYIIGKALRYNGFVITYIGWDTGNGRRVAVEEYMASDFATRAEGDQEVTIYSGDAAQEYARGLSLFLKEGKEMKRLGNVPAIAAVYDCCAQNATGYLIREYLSGKRLKEALPAGKRLTYAQAEKIMEPLLQGLGTLHQAGVMHYDIAPDNILLTADGKVKLVDFGAARYVTSARSKSLAVLIKQGYTPQEQYHSQGKKGSWSDVYAAAAVYYRMLTGIVPQESIERVLQDNLKEPSKCNVEMPKGAENALMNALNLDVSERTKTIRQFWQELKSEQVKRIQPKQKNSQKGWGFKKIAAAGIAAAVIAVGAAAVTHTQSAGLDREAAGTYMLSAAELNDLLPDGEEAVAARLAELGFDEDSIEFIYEYSSDNESDMIFETVPAGQEQLTDELLQKGASVHIGSSKYVSVSGQDMKNLETKKIKNAVSILKNRYGFTNIKTKENADYDDGMKGTVYRVSGNFSKKTSCTETVNILIAKGSIDSYKEEVPYLIGKDYEQYKKDPEITPVRVDVFGTGWENAKDGAIVKTSKNAGETIITGGPDGEEFLCYVWNRTPDLTALTESNVKTQLAKVGITAQQGEDQYSDSAAQGSLIFDDTKLVEGQKETVVYHKSLGVRPAPQPQPKQDTPQGGGTSSGGSGTSSGGSSTSQGGGSSPGGNNASSNGSSTQSGGTSSNTGEGSGLSGGDDNRKVPVTTLD